MDVPVTLAEAADEDYCYVTTTGRATGNAHTVEIWLALSNGTLYILSGGRDASLPVAIDARRTASR